MERSIEGDSAVSMQTINLDRLAGCVHVDVPEKIGFRGFEVRYLICNTFGILSQ